MNTIVEIFKQYNGTGYYCVLFIIALIYLWNVEEDKRIKAILVYTPTVIQVLFFIPYFYILYNYLDDGTYYRILWLLPMSVVIAYAGCKLIGVHTKIGLALLSAILILGGTYVYKSQYMSVAENEYHLPGEVIEICDMIMPEEGKQRVWAAFPIDLIHYVRQYTTRIQMPYGREALALNWIPGTENPIFLMYREQNTDLETFVDLVSENYCNYVIFEKERVLEGGKPEEFDLIKIGETTHYDVYRNMNVDFFD